MFLFRLLVPRRNVALPCRSCRSGVDWSFFSEAIIYMSDSIQFFTKASVSLVAISVNRLAIAPTYLPC